jgi:hypothetical protein
MKLGVKNSKSDCVIDALPVSSESVLVHEDLKAAVSRRVSLLVGPRVRLATPSAEGMGGGFDEDCCDELGGNVGPDML